MTTNAALTTFWLEEVGQTGWYAVDAALDATIAARFGPLWEDALAGGLKLWLSSPDLVLAYIILTDQFPRNMFRGSARAFASDALARYAALRALSQGWDLRIPEPQRQFMYLPFVHSEVQVDQDRGVRLMNDRLPLTGAGNLLHARAHRDVIRRFGRFPFRNAALGRASTPNETRFLEAGGYATLVKALAD